MIESKRAKELLQRKISLLDADDELIKTVQATERSLFSKIRDILLRFTIKAGRFAENTGQIGLFATLQDLIFDAISQSTYGSKIGKYLTNFDKIENASVSLIQEIHNTDKTLPRIGREKKIIVNNLVENLTSKAAITVNIVNPLREILYRQITSGVTFKEAEDALRTYLKGTGDGGQITRYVTQITRDAINQYDGTIQNEFRKELDLDGFQIVGSLLYDEEKGRYKSRPNCVHMVNGTSYMEQYALGDGVYAMQDLPDIIQTLQGRAGWNDATTVDNYFIYRNGYNCRHQIIPIKLNEQQKEILNSKN